MGSSKTMELAVAAAALEQAKKDSSPNNGDQTPPGMSPLDYVKNKIVEEMKKHGEDGLPLPNPAAINLKRSSPDQHAAASEVEKKKAKLEADEAASAAATVNSVP